MSPASMLVGWWAKRYPEVPSTAVGQRLVPKISPDRIQLGQYPTPIVRLDRLTEMLQGPILFMKLDSLSGIGMGGNKIRKLEFLLADARNRGCDSVITGGAAQSNHCRQTAACAARLGVECHLVLSGENSADLGGNILLDKLFGAHIHWSDHGRKGEDIAVVCERLKSLGKVPYTIPYGGSCELGAWAFIEAMSELEAQRQSMNEEFSHIAFASGSGGTHAGMLLGQKVLNLRYQIYGFSVDKGEPDAPSLGDQILEIASRTNTRFELGLQVGADDVVLDESVVGTGYGRVGSVEREAIQMLARAEGIVLDPVYTAKAMAGLIGMVRSKKWTKKDKVLFWHTGGEPAIFAKAAELLAEP